ncbi:MAG: quinone oxidoreductase family protein [Magnetospiraceae bacterium]
MTMAIRIHEPGGPEKMVWEAVDVPDPGPRDVRLRQTAVGLNFIDVYMRSGLYPLSSMPVVLGLEAAGVVEAIGEGVTDLAVGDRVAYAGGPPGAYAESRILVAKECVRLPDAISDEQGAAMMLQGMTAAALLRRTFAVKPGDTILMHAAAGGVGLIVCQWAKALGATVIGTVGSDEKAALAQAHGCDHTIVYTRENFTERTRELTGGRGVDVVYDSIGQDTFFGSLDSLRRLGTMVTFGNASGPVKPFAPLELTKRGSLTLVRPTLFHYTTTREELLGLATELFDMVLAGKLKIEVNQRYPLAEAALAHQDLEGRKTTGSTVLTV